MAHYSDLTKAGGYKKSPKLARSYMTRCPPVEKRPCVVLKPLSQARGSETSEAVAFLVNADQLSGLATLASYDMDAQDKEN